MKYIILSALLLFSALCHSQVTKKPLLKGDASWASEIIQFPIDWAPGLTLQGFEELRFAPEWDQQKSVQFWSLVLAWSVQTNQALSTTKITDNMEHYFDGLMQPNDFSIKIPIVNLVLLKKEITTNHSSWIGRMKVHDNFHTNKLITLNITVDQYFCETDLTSQVVFRFSPQELEHSIWQSLDAIQLKNTVCK